MTHFQSDQIFFFFFLLLNIGLLLERAKKAKSFYFMLSLLSRSGYWQTLEIIVKNFLTVISNGPSFKLFTLNQVVDVELFRTTWC